jgi:hypothetical protein
MKGPDDHGQLWLRDDDSDDVLDLGDGRRGVPTELIGLLAVLALVTVGGIWLATSGSSPRPATSQSVSRPPAERLTLPATAPSPTLHLGPVHTQPADPTRCPATIACVTTDAVPRPVITLIRRYFPGAIARDGYTVFRSGPRSGHGLWFRQMIATTRRVEVLVLVSVRKISVGSPQRVDGATLGYIWLRAHGYEVQVQVNGPRRFRPPLARIRALAAEPGLERLR